jgi:hypothetical protein
MASATAATSSLSAAQTASATSSAVARTGLQQLTAGAAPMTLALTGAGGAMQGLAAGARTLGATLSAALGPIGLVVGAVAMIGSALYEAHRQKEEDRKKTAQWAKEYTDGARKLSAARDEIARSHRAMVEASEAAANTDTLEHELELLTLLGGSTEQIAEKQAEIHESRVAALGVARATLTDEQSLARLEVQRAEAALSRLRSERITAAAISDSKKKAEAMHEVELKILDAQDAVNAALATQNATRERALELTQQQIALDRQRQQQEAKGKRDAIEIVKGEAIAAFTGARDSQGAVPIEALQGAREIVIQAGGSEADADEVVSEIISGTFKPTAKKGGGKKAPKEEKIEARFGDYRDVLKAYADSRAGVDAKALDSLAKGVMPKDHKPETSITVTNNNNYTFDSEIVIDAHGKASQPLAQDIAAHLRAEFEKAIRQTPNGLVR